MEQSKTAEKPKQPIRVLWLSDFACATGFAQVAQNICAQVLKTKNFSIDVIGINYQGMPNEWQQYYPMIRLLPAMQISGGDLFGRRGLLEVLASGNYDILFTLQDTFIIETIGKQIIEIRNALISKNMKSFRWIYYFPIDAKPKENWIRDSLALADYPVVYTQYGYNEIIKQVPEVKYKLKQIPHGYDDTLFFPLPKNADRDKLRDHYFVGKANGKFVITNINRNQPRKDVARTMQIFRLFKNQVPDALLYLHMKSNDVAYDLHEVARNYNLIPDEDYIIPKDFNEHDGVSVQVLNAIYNMSDVIMTTTLGEGWGLSMTEAMATKTPVIAPNHTSLTEMLEGRGTLVTAGKSITDWVILQQDNERLRPLVDIPEYVDKLVKIRQNYKEAEALAEKAYTYVKENLTWNTIGKQWVEIFNDAATPKQQVKIGRNDPCFCGSGKKYKHCHLNNG